MSKNKQSLLENLQADLVLKLDEIVGVCSEYSYEIIPTLILRSPLGSGSSIVIGSDKTAKAIQVLVDLEQQGLEKRMTVDQAARSTITRE